LKVASSISSSTLTWRAKYLETHMSDKEETNDQEISEEQRIFEEKREEWTNLLAHLAINGEPFFADGLFTMRITSETEIIDIGIKRTPNNIIQFPVKTKQEKPKAV
jgi:hypothetical protein